jgi:hypothetical protein
MTQGPPAGTSGHSTDQISSDLGLNPETQAAAIERANRLEAQKKAKEAEVVSDDEKRERNKAREIRREAGEQSVEDDEIISDAEDDNEEPGDKPESHAPEIPKSWEELVSAASPRSLKGIYAIAGLVKQSMSIDTAGKAVNTAVNSASNWIGGKRVKVSALTEETFSSVSNQKYPFSPLVWGLFDKKQYLPLTLFTSKSMQKLWEQPSSCPTKNISIHGEGNKIAILNVTPFGEEKDLSIAQWHEAHNNYDAWLGEAYEDDIAAHWIQHHRFLTSIDNFEKNFPAILKFDVAERTSYTFRPMNFNQDAYSNRWSLITMETLKESVESSLKILTTTPTSGPTRNSYSSGPRTKPYDDSRKQPFSEGRSSKTGGTTCLICARAGHRAGECTKTTLENGKPVTATFSNNSIISMGTRKLHCFSWNMGGPRRCGGKHSNENIHACTFCQSTEHHSLSRKCL